MTRFDRDDRGVSIAVTHVLTVGITAILISGLLIAGSTLLETEQERSTESTLETIGERLAGEIAAVDQTTDGTDSITVTTSHQRSVGGSGYTVSLTDKCGQYPLIDTSPCLVLEASATEPVAIPLALEDDIDTTTVDGGEIHVTRDESSGNITLEDS
ncbi:hypothetical protein Halru_1293 [Halovivax ruber XH-70]|uniref:Archaeal flagellin-like protein n=1 Tax=Halovivax ruber (strain DSM 18193 / JCM 13892 / XH-70) TaxID=797302 RepID=L0ID77_HALRX|nr:hypothetical protein [Halovivax ruber]AGB15907.1 hypothetical protein Halru_1293 [Halovivax ruber XH-70]